MCSKPKQKSSATAGKAKRKNPGSESSKYSDSFAKRRIGGSTLYCPPDQERFDLTNLFGKPTGASGTGVNTKGTPLGTTQQRAKRPYTRQRNQQVLRQLSQKLYNAVKSSVGSEQEVELMFVNDRLVISANLPASIDLIKAHMETGDPTLEEFLQKEGSADDRRITAFNLKLAKRMSRRPQDDDPDKDQQARAFLTRLKDAKTSELIKVVDFDISAVTHADLDSSPCMTGDAFKDKVVLLRLTGGTQPAKADGGVTLHAEQGLIQLALLADKDRDIVKKNKLTICGGKRPCQGCLTALKLMRDLGYEVEFNERPGMYWSTSCETVERLLMYVHNHKMTFQNGMTAAEYFEAMKAKASAPPDSHVTLNKYTSAEDQGFNTDSDSEVDTDEYNASAIIKSATARLKDLKGYAAPRLNDLVGAAQGCKLSAIVKLTPLDQAIKEAEEIIRLMDELAKEILLAQKFLQIQGRELAALIDKEKGKTKPVKKKLQEFDFRASGFQMLEQEAADLFKEVMQAREDCVEKMKAFIEKQRTESNANEPQTGPDVQMQEKMETENQVTV